MCLCVGRMGEPSSSPSLTTERKTKDSLSSESDFSFARSLSLSLLGTLRSPFPFDEAHLPPFFR